MRARPPSFRFPDPMSGSELGVLIVGASAAGLSTATALRRRGYGGRIRLLESETVSLYDRPPLSKQFLAGAWEDDRLALLEPRALTDLDLEIELGVVAEELDLSRRAIVDQSGHRHAYDDLVIATGLRPRRLPALSSIDTHVLRTLDDARKLRSAVGPGIRVVVVGAGFIGLEAAATLRRLECDVVVIDPVPAPLADRLGADTAGRLLALHSSEGVDVRTGTIVVEAGASRCGTATLLLSDGSELTAEVVIEAVGSVTNTEWLTGSGLRLENGVICDAGSQAAQHVWAAGDVARWRHVGYGRDLRVEHRTHATEHGQHVAAAILGSTAPFTPLPFFWTDHYEARVQVAGLVPVGAEATRVEVAGKPDSHLLLFRSGGAFVGVLGWNAPREIGSYRRELLASLVHTAPVTA
jgi:NADPH-dependent 2,4-dienoyl-CoA reductase/sulfur reductase-like enzyme